ncbi:MAG: hypothetical protein K9N49_04500, partial [Candidatus Marinimicrobia bacterium]|nr:hypothetical protein [Candidatus Neomarinimicrobiota bacterium]
PYLRVQGWMLSPLMGFGWGLLALACLAPARWTRDKGCRLVLLIALALLAWGLWPRLGPYRANYSHFSELLIAKLRFLNRKPLDPGLLTFNQRILWVPALHSASWALTVRLFPGLLGLWLLVAATGWRTAWRRREAIPIGWLLAGACSWLAYVFFVRFHVFVALFAALSAGAWLGSLAARPRPKIIAGWLIVLGAFTLEAAQTLRAPERWGRPNVYYQELRELTDWLRANAPSEPIVANFGLSAYVLTYAGNPIVLHPKFETPALRDRVEQYGTLLFTAPERALRDWIAAHDTELYIYALGEFFPDALPLQMRYFVNALDPPPDAPARRFEREPLAARYFHFLWGNRKYRVFRILTPAAERLAAEQAARAQERLEIGDLEAAHLLAAAALENDPGQPRAQRVLGHVLALQRAGFDPPPAADPAP